MAVKIDNVGEGWVNEKGRKKASIFARQTFVKYGSNFRITQRWFICLQCLYFILLHATKKYYYLFWNHC